MSEKICQTVQKNGHYVLVSDKRNIFTYKNSIEKEKYNFYI